MKLLTIYKVYTVIYHTFDNCFIPITSKIKTVKKITRRNFRQIVHNICENMDSENL